MPIISASASNTLTRFSDLLNMKLPGFLSLSSLPVACLLSQAGHVLSIPTDIDSLTNLTSLQPRANGNPEARNVVLIVELGLHPAFRNDGRPPAFPVDVTVEFERTSTDSATQIRLATEQVAPSWRGTTPPFAIRPVVHILRRDMRRPTRVPTSEEASTNVREIFRFPTKHAISNDKLFSQLSAQGLVMEALAQNPVLSLGAGGPYTGGITFVRTLLQLALGDDFRVPGYLGERLRQGETYGSINGPRFVTPINTVIVDSELELEDINGKWVDRGPWRSILDYSNPNAPQNPMGGFVGQEGRSPIIPQSDVPVFHFALP